MEYAASKMIGRRIERAAHRDRLRAARPDKRKIVKEQIFTLNMINNLRAAYGTSPTISLQTANKLRTFLDKVAKYNYPLIVQLAAANIKFVSVLASNRLKEVDREKKKS